MSEIERERKKEGVVEISFFLLLSSADFLLPEGEHFQHLIHLIAYLCFFFIFQY